MAFETGQRQLPLETDTARAVLDLRRGLAINTLSFPILGDKPALGTLPHGHFDDISFGADFYSGHSVVQRPGHRKLTDLQACAPATNITRLKNGNLLARTEISDHELTVIKEIEIDSTRPRIILKGQLDLPSRRAGEIHPLHLTVIPGLFQKDHLRFRTKEAWPPPRASLKSGMKTDVW